MADSVQSQSTKPSSIEAGRSLPHLVDWDRDDFKHSEYEYTVAIPILPLRGLTNRVQSVGGTTLYPHYQDSL